MCEREGGVQAVCPKIDLGIMNPTCPTPHQQAAPNHRTNTRKGPVSKRRRMENNDSPRGAGVTNQKGKRQDTHDIVRHVDHLAHLQVPRDAAQHVRVHAAEPVVGPQARDHVPHRVARGFAQVCVGVGVGRLASVCARGAGETG